MGSISSSLASAANAMQVLQRSVSVVQNNITNASTANYARQDQVILANPFVAASSSLGGISAGPLLSSRSYAAENAVWRQQGAAGYAGQSRATFSSLQQALPVTKDSGIPAAMDQFFASASRLAMSPNSLDARQDLLYTAGAAARSFNAAAGEISNLTGATGNAIASTVTEINRLAAEIASVNAARQGTPAGAGNAGLDTRLYSALESLSALVPYTALPDQDGSMRVLIGGEIPLVLGDESYSLEVDAQNTRYEIQDAQGVPVTAKVAGGQLGALLDARNRSLPAVAAQLDSLAQAFADSVNVVLAGGLDQSGAPPSRDLFSYSAVGVAASLNVNGLTPEELAAAGAADPGGNSNANRLAQLTTAPVAGGLTLSSLYAGLAGGVGRQVNTQTAGLDASRQLLLQAQGLRQELSGVSIDAEALKLLDLQRGFEAVGRVISVLDQLSQTVLNMLH